MQSNFVVLLRRLGLLILIYSLCRLLFLIFNFSYFAETDLSVILKSFFFGVRFDLTAVIISNILFISLHLLPFRFFYTIPYQRVLRILFNLVNIPLLLLNSIDWGLFKFTGKRTGAEIFKIMSFGNDFINTLPKMIIDFWYLLIIFFLIIYLMNRFYPKADHLFVHKIKNKPAFINTALGKSVLFLIFTGLTFIGFRGGVQLKPLNILAASRYGTGKTTALVLNTSFTVIKTVGKQTISETHWMPDEEALRISPVIKVPREGATFSPKNVVIIILESFGKEYIGSLNGYEGYTPFLDSLIGKSLVYENAYANGKRSIEGIPAIVAGIPALLPDPFITSAYSSNTITTLPSLLKSKGYTSVFFHGGTNGTMGFDNFSKLSGFDNYFGRTEYADDEDFDGSWGIYDEPFLLRSVREMNKMNQPFLSAIFTISSHHPYKIPGQYAGKFPVGTLPIHQSIGYADYSLKKFFESASASEWYSNTLFVITADHTAISEKPFYQGRAGLYSIPIIFYSPSDPMLHGRVKNTIQQIDILPCVLDYLGYDQPYFAFGKNMLNDNNSGYAISFIDETYQLIRDHYSLIMGNNEKYNFYNFENDSTLKKDIAGTDTTREKNMEMQLHAFLQNFNHAMIFNQMK